MKDFVIVTGASGGLGRALVKQFALQGNYSIVGIGRNKTKLETLGKELKAFGGGCNYLAYTGDIRDEKFVATVMEELGKKGNIKMLINNACEVRFVSPTDNTSEVVDITLGGLKGMILCSTYALREMQKCGGKVINIMSTAAQKGNAGESAYCACKWGERGYTESLKAYYKGSNIKIMGVYPGGMNTSFFDKSPGYISKEKVATFSDPAEVAKIIICNALNDKLDIGDITVNRI